MHIQEFQNHMKRLYYHKDSKRGAEKTYIWFTQEVGELGKAMLDKDKEAIKNETSDVLAWLLSLCNLLDIDLEEAAVSKYGNNCPKCNKSPCECPFN